MSRDDETEPMTRLLGTIAHTPRQDEPHRRLVDTISTISTISETQQRLTDGATRLEIARPTITSSEPATKIVDPSTLRLAFSIEHALLPSAAPHIGPHDEVTVPRPRLSVKLEDEVTARRAQRRTMPFMLALLLAVVCLGTGASLLQPHIRGAKLEGTQPAATQPAAAPSAVQAEPPAASHVTSVTAPPADRPVRVPEPSAPVEPGVVAELEKRAVDRLRDNDHPGALALYRELTSVAEHPAYPVMIALLERRVHGCTGDPRCGR